MKSLLDNAKEIQMSTDNIHELVDIMIVKLQDSINNLVDLRESKAAIARETCLNSRKYTIKFDYSRVGFSGFFSMINKTDQIKCNPSF